MTEARAEEPQVPFTLVRLDHLVLRVRDLHAAEGFYRSAFGCTVERRRPDLGLLHLRAGTSLIDLVDVQGPLGRAGGAAAGAEGRNLDHLCLRIEPFDEARIALHLRACGARPLRPVTRNFGAEGEGPSLYVADPEGNVIELKGPGTPGTGPGEADAATAAAVSAASAAPTELAAPAVPAAPTADPTRALRPMTPAEYEAWMQATVPAYAADKIASGQWSAAEALALSAAEYRELLPQGLATADNHLHSVIDADGTVVGMLWFAVQPRGGASVAYVYDVEIGEAHRRRGHALRAFRALEAEARRLGLAGIALHVFGHNRGAQRLYESLGFAPTNISLFKPLA